MSIHDLLTIGSGLAAVIVMILLVRHGTRLTGHLARRGKAQTMLAVRASLAIDGRRRLSLVECDVHRLLAAQRRRERRHARLGLPAEAPPPPRNPSS